MPYKINKHHFHLPTPKKWVRIGNSLVATAGFVSTTIGLYADFEYKTESIIAILAIGGIGWFLTKFFSADKIEN